MLSDSPVHDLRKPNLPADLRRAMLQFAGRRTLEVKKTAIKEIVGAYGFSRLRHYESLSFYFRQQPVASVWTEGIFFLNSTGPSLAYVTFDGIQSRRSKFVHNSPGKGFNWARA
ncbi:methyltransferase domain family protein [Aspergillus tubingensis]|uniref:methyltransferase domain family protein n=1 Tax=Aspergillus tubingensis TaxID=5068 RepID=UPI001578FD01|nr:methyltransferase domain family protein [Aspergillus tubingensis]GFN21250.1 methyltransferase domain family protein [Aspergillus tubingensis]